MQAHGTIALVADDHELFRTALSAVLKRDLGFERVIETGSLDEALEFLSATPQVSFACFDLAMPGMDGAKSLSGVREVFPHVRVAVVTGSTRREDILLALAAGVHGYVPKVLRIDEITRALRLMLDGVIFVPASLAEIGPGVSATLTEAGGVEATGVKPTLVSLPPRQSDVLRLLAQGKSNKEIARILDLAEGTVKVHVTALFRNLGVHNRAGAVAAAARLTQADNSSQ